MNKQEAKNLIIKTFENSFDEARYLYFIKNLLNNLNESKQFEYHGQFIPASFRDAVKQYKRLGQYKDSDNNTIDVLIVNLKRGTTLERARTFQRNFIAWYLKQKNREAALVAYYTEESEDWRFSLVKMEFNLSKEKILIELSPAKRYSFLVGVNEKSHTAQNQFVNLLIDKEVYPTLVKIEEAFNIETVTKEFFLEYRDLFIRTKEALDKVIKNDPKLKSDFDSKNVNSVDFSKKLLGQIIFLYFLQKKGWFGVERDSDWGKGSKQFLRELFEKKHCNYDNFYNDILEPLFYEALRIDRSHDDHYYSRFNCKIPFLNGGLFDPIGNYDWVHTDIIMPNELFSNSHKTMKGDLGDGLLDIFDRYNFTVIEDEPLEKEVAIDPELLGKAYEKFNAIRPDNFNEYQKVLKSGKKGEENKFNKQYGVYYTPREIVHYMCRESLINYLASEFNDKTDSYQKISSEQLDAFGNTARKGQLSLEAEYKPHPYIPKEDIEKLISYGELLGENEAVVVSNGKETETYSYKLSESVRKNANLIDTMLSDILVCDPAVGSGAFPVGMMHEIVSTRNILSNYIKDKNRTIYKFKRDCIEKSLYGVDIDSGAVEIAKLRLWLSLIVYEDNINKIKPLPNLDYKVLRGDSLLGFPTGTVKNTVLENAIESLKQKYFNSKDVNEKRELNKNISIKFSELLEEAKQFSNKVMDITFDFEVFFSEVFHHNDKCGFDIIIGNPPYGVSIKNEYRKNVLLLLPKVPDYEIFYFFIEVAYKYLKHNGIVTYIIPNSILFNVFAANYRLKLLEVWNILEILDCTDFDLFESVTVRNAIIRFSRTKEYTSIGFKNTSEALSFSELASRNLSQISKSDLIRNNINWALAFRLSRRVLNFIASLKNKSNSLQDFFPEISQGLIAYDKYRGQSKKIIKERAYHYLEKVKPSLKPWLWGEDVTRYSVKWNGKEYIDYCNGIANPREPKYFKGSRVLVREITNPSIFASYTSKEMYNDPSIIIIKEGKIIPILSLLAILNSKFATYYHFNSSPKATKGAFPKIILEDIKHFPLVTPSDKANIYYTALAGLATNVLNSKLKDNNLNTKQLEDQIDLLVYKLYNLTYEEVEIIDTKIGDIINKKDYDKFEIKA